jgi:hypothetical protein
MKKLVIVLAAFILSCSAEDTNTSTQSQDLIIGTWGPVKLTEYPSNGPEIVTPSTDCYKKSRVHFRANGDLDQVSFYQNDGTCKQRQEDANLESRTWKKIGEGIYRFTEVRKTSTGELTENSNTPDKISFSDNNTMEILYFGSNRPLNDPVKVEYYVNTFTRISN